MNHHDQSKSAPGASGRAISSRWPSVRMIAKDTREPQGHQCAQQRPPDTTTRGHL